jgi:hypothetical protein
VIAARLELDLLTGLDLQAAGDLAHLHNAPFRFHFMNLEGSRLRQRAADQPIRLIPGIRDGHVSGADIGSGGGCARPRLIDNN